MLVGACSGFNNSVAGSRVEISSHPPLTRAPNCLLFLPVGGDAGRDHALHAETLSFLVTLPVAKCPETRTCCGHVRVDNARGGDRGRPGRQVSAKSCRKRPGVQGVHVCLSLGRTERRWLLFRFRFFCIHRFGVLVVAATVVVSLKSKGRVWEVCCFKSRANCPACRRAFTRDIMYPYFLFFPYRYTIL